MPKGARDGGSAIWNLFITMNLDALKANIKPLDPSCPPVISDVERDYFRYYGLNFEEQFEFVTHRFGHFECNRFDIVAHYFENKNASKTCFIVHGYYDHAGLFSKLIEYCLQREFSVVIYDLPGHGLSTGERASITSFADYQQVLKAVLARFDGVAKTPWYAIGQSTGGAILMDFILSGDENTFEKTVLLSPLYQPKGWKIGRITHALLSPFIKRIERKFVNNSHDLKFLKFLKELDPLQYRYLSLQWVTALKQWLPYFDQLPATNYAPLIIQGQEDTTVEWRLNMQVIQKKFPQAKILYLNKACHHLVNESEDIREKTYAAMDFYFGLG